MSAIFYFFVPSFSNLIGNGRRSAVRQCQLGCVALETLMPWASSKAASGFSLFCEGSVVFWVIFLKCLCRLYRLFSNHYQQQQQQQLLIAADDNDFLFATVLMF